MRVPTLKTAGAVTALALLANLNTSPAYALDLKTFPGTFCQSSGSAQSLYYSSKGPVANRTSRARSAICPLVRDNTSDDMVGLRVTVRDRHPSQSVRCVLNSVPRNGSGGWSQTKSTGGVFQGFITLSFNGIDQAPGGTYTLVCQLPGMVANLPSYLSSYQLIEP